MLSVVSHGLYSEVARWVSKLQVKPNPAASSCALPRKSTCCASVAIVARQQIDKARVEAAGLGEAGLQARQMLLGRFMLGGEHPAAAEKNGDILQPRRLQAVGELPPLGYR